MDTQNNIPDMNTSPKLSETSGRRKKGGAGFLIFIIILVLALAGGAAYYLTERRKPQKAVEDFLESMQKMDFTSMEALLQSNDLSVLDNADIRDAAYTDFFKQINEKMSYKILKNNFDLQNGTARITVRLTYIDGTEIYKETISEFLRQIVSTAFSGNTLTDEQTKETLSNILLEKSQQVEDKFTEADVIYPLIKTDDQWKIVSLDEDTVKIMSANFKSVEDEIAQSLENTGENTDGSVDILSSPSESDIITIETDKFTISYTQYRIAKDFSGKPCLMYYYDYTNNSSSPSSAMVDVSIQAYQNGKLLEAAIPETNDAAADRYMAEIQPGEQVNVCQVFSLNDTSDVTLMASEAFNFGDGKAASQIVKVE